MRSLTWEQVLGRRLQRSHLVEPAADDRRDENVVARVVGEVAGVQAQIMSAAELTVGARVAGLTQPDVRAELFQRRTPGQDLRPARHPAPAARC